MSQNRGRFELATCDELLVSASTPRVKVHQMAIPISLALDLRGQGESNGRDGPIGHKLN